MGINCDGEVLFAEKSTVQLTRWLDSTDQPFLTFAFHARRPAADRSSMTTCVYMATNNLTRVHLYNMYILCTYTYIPAAAHRPANFSGNFSGVRPGPDGDPFINQFCRTTFGSSRPTVVGHCRISRSFVREILSFHSTVVYNLFPDCRRHRTHHIMYTARGRRSM